LPLQRATALPDLRAAISKATVKYNSITDVRNEAINLSPYKYELGNNYPNPFNPSTKISFTLPGNTVVSMRIYNQLGELVEELFNSPMSAGRHQ